ncbi:MAG: ribulokinase [Eubacterium sp.]|nr:ribulokinase [Eubacterium sp.]MDD7210703.1 ribulokinase [Lachnospiraceae bacterium]MDY5496832.1 ribulokinase [Anaerobutyricum sp.]
MGKYAIGLDYGTLSVRALLINVETREEVGSYIYEYPHGSMETELPCGKKLPINWALQHPADYVEGLEKTIRGVVSENHIPPEEVIGIGVDFTSSTILPVLSDKTPLCELPEFKEEPNAYVKLWKHHGAEKQAQYIDRICKERGEEWLSLYGGKVSSEWMLPKVLETVEMAPEVYRKADRFMEAMDWITWILTGEESRSACAAGYKMFYHHEKGYPGKEFFKALNPMMENFVEEKLEAPIKGVGECAGYLTKEMADRLGLKEGTPVATAIIDAHASVPACGIDGPGKMLIIMGTSSCHMIQSEKEEGIPGNCGIVKDGMIPGYFGYESGQCCVGDQFAWFVKNCVPEKYAVDAREKGMNLHTYLTEKCKDLEPGESGLVALDWFNGVRSPLMDFNLTGMILGMNLQTKPEEIYLALLESTAYGTRMIMENFENHGVEVNEIVVAGGIANKNPLLMQIYADVCNKTVRICGTEQSGALGSAILGIIAAGEEVSGYQSAQDVIAAFGRLQDVKYVPDAKRVAAYEKLYQEYTTLFDYFGKGENDVMKRLMEGRK